MQTINTNPYADARFVDMEVMIDVSDKSSKTVSASVAESGVSNISQVLDFERNMTKKIGTLELNQCLLGGDYVFPNGTDGQVGYRSGPVSNANRECDIKLSVFLSENIGIPGLMIDFDGATNEYPESFTIMVFNVASTQTSLYAPIYTINVQGNKSPHYKLIKEMQDVRAIGITFNKTYAPFKKIKVAEITVGIVDVFNRDTAIDMSVLFEFSPTTDALPSAELVIKSDNLDNRYDPFAKSNIYAMIREGMQIPLRIGVGETSDIEYILRGFLRFASSKTSEGDRLVDIVANDANYMLDDAYYDGGRLEVRTLVNAIGELGEYMPVVGLIPVLRMKVAANVASRQVYMALDNMPLREAIQKVVQAARCWAYIDVNGEMQIVDGKVGSSVHTYDKNMMLDDPDVELVKPNENRTLFGTYRYIAKSASETIGTENIVNSTGSTDRMIGSFGHDYLVSRSLSVTPASVTLLNRVDGTKYTYFELSVPAGVTAVVTLTGRPYEKIEETSGSMRSADVINPAIVPTGTGSNVYAVENWYNAIDTDMVKYKIPDRGNPALTLCDTVTINGRNALIYKQEYKFDGGLTCDMEATGD